MQSVMRLASCSGLPPFFEQPASHIHEWYTFGLSFP